MSECTVDDCTRKPHARGLCSTHYGRKLRTGTTDYTPPTLEDRFFQKVLKTSTCWLWQAYITPNGYGQIGDGYDVKQAHRASYEMFKGPIPEGMFIDHICHVRHCVRPEHLRLVTNKQNLENRAGPPSNNTSGYRGVSWSKSNKGWIGQLKHHGEHFHLGTFRTPEEANAVVVAKRLELYTHNDLDRRAA